MLADHDAGPWISPQMRRLHVAAARDDAETALAPFVPDRRQQDGAVAPVRGQDRQQAEFGQVSEIFHGEASAHPARLTGSGPATRPVVRRVPALLTDHMTEHPPVRALRV